MYFSNLKATFKFVGIVWLPLSGFIVFDCFRNEDFSNVFMPIYFLAFAPALALSTLFYTSLKNSKSNRFTCSALFGIANTLLFMSYYFIGLVIDNGELNERFVIVMSFVAFLTSAGLYLQLPWKQNDA